MNNLTVTWKLPTSRTGGGQLTPADLDDTIVEMSADGGSNYSPLDPVPPDAPQQAYIPDLPFGTYHFRITVVDLLGQTSAPLEGSYTLQDTSAPNPATDLTFAIS